MYYKPLCVLLLCFSCVWCQAQNAGHLVLSEARFKTGDEIAWKDPSFDDKDWETQKLGKVWQSQGHPKYHGYAWYRIHVTIPSSLKEKNVWKDSLRIFLAHVNDVDDTYLNGVKIGHIGSFPDEPGGYVSKWPAVREYNVAATNPAIYWDKDNVIAVRVYDHTGSGGIFMGQPYVDMLEKINGVHIELNNKDIVYHSRNEVQATVTLSNQYRTTVQGSFQYVIDDVALGKQVEEKTMSVQLSPLEKKKITIRLPHRPGIELRTLFKEIASGITLKQSIILPYILTPPVADKPRLNTPGVYGVQPSHPLLYKIPATGKSPLTYAVKNLPEGIQLDAQKGILTGSMAKAGDYPLQIVVKNALGKAEKTLILKVGTTIALTPQMGWNSWNCWGLSVSDAKVRSSAQALLDKGLVNHGWSYINVDDGWEAPKRAEDGSIVPNEKFPDMKALGNYLHNNGLKFGMYSSPGPQTCGGYLGSYQHEVQDAQTYVSWGVDYLKYDLCSYYSIMPKERTLADHQKPYQIMRDALASQNRDILYSICQYGDKEVWKWGEAMNGNSWRTTEDITDTWESLYQIGFSQDKMATYAKPGHWNDPDMLIVGMVGWGENLHPTRLTPDEQYTHMSLWSLLSAPLLLGCDLAKLDPFTLNLLTNDEVIAIDQDVAGKQARLVTNADSIQVWVKELSDGKKAIGIFNLNKKFQTTTLNWQSAQLPASCAVRDVWRQTNLGIKPNNLTVGIPAHGVFLCIVSPAAKTAKTVKKQDK